MACAVSVVMPAYNCENYVAQAIASVQRQTMPDWELIVVEDCSTDATRTLVETLARQDKRIRLLCNERNLGAAESRNVAFPHCTGDYVALLDSDDLWMPEKLEKQLRMARESRADIVYCAYAIIDETGKKKCPDFLVPPRTDFRSMLVRSTISSSTALLRRELTVDHLFSGAFYHEDLAYWLGLLKEGQHAAGVQEVLAAYRIVPGSRAANKFRCAGNRWKIFHDFLGFSAFRSTLLLAEYASLGLQKYRPVF